MQGENYSDVFVNFSLWDGRLKFIDHCLERKKVNFICPLENYEDIGYDQDSFELYEELIADNLEENQELMMDEEDDEVDSNNKTIVPDGYLSDAELSSEV